jgi:hypothetical protein
MVFLRWIYFIDAASLGAFVVRGGTSSAVGG